jgi:hypothetical protein
LVPVPSGSDVLTLRVSDPAGAPACLQLDSLLDPAGSAWVSSGAGDLGPYCVSCPERVSVGIGYGLFVLPSSAPAPAMPSALEVSAGVRDCTTLLPADAELGAVRIEGLFAPAAEPDRVGVISLGLAFLSVSPLADEARREAVLPETLRLVNELLAPGALSVTVARTRSVVSQSDSLDLIRGAPGPLDLIRGASGPLDALYGELIGQGPRLANEPATGACPSPPEDGWVPVVFAGCIRVVDSLEQTTSEPDALTPGIPDGFPPPGRAQGIFLKGQSCRPRTTTASGAIDWPPSLLAKLLAHELGHYLGLYHSVEADGTLDQLADTDETNLMYYSPLTVPAAMFSPSQFQVMRRHPAISWSSAR